VHKRHLKNLVIAPGFQGRFLIWFSFHLVVFGLSYGLFVTYLLKSTFQILLDQALFTPDQRASINGDFNELLLRLLVATIAFVLLCALSALLFSHRSAGPMYRFVKLFEEVKAGNLGARCHLRAKDEMKDVAQAFNEMMSAIEERSKKGEPGVPTAGPESIGSG
jgi:methyl-accepting chemotaxis protein